MGVTTYDETAPALHAASIAPGDGTNPVDLALPVGRSERVDAIVASTDSASDRVVILLVTPEGSSATTSVGYATVPANAGMGVVPAVDLLPSLVTYLQGGIVLPAGAKLQAAVTVAVPSGKTVDLLTFGGLL